MIGILNGTCNYILTKIHHEKDPSHRPAEAQAEGLPKPIDLDVEGLDTAHKLSILSALHTDWNQF
jgi:homoserine dehydrogenase